MRGFVVATWVCAIAVIAAAPDAHAKRKKPKAAALEVAVMPFEGKGSGGDDVKEALELELELIPTVSVVGSESVAAEIERASIRKRTDATTLATAMKKRSVDVLITGARGAGERNPDALIVVAYAADGRPHFVKELPLGGEPDVTAAAISGALKGPLSSWKAQRVVPLPGDDEDDGGGRGIDPGDVLVDEDAPPAKDVIDDPPKDEPVREVPRADPSEAGKGDALAFNDPDDGSEDVLKPRDGGRRKSRLDDDAPAGDGSERLAVADLDDEGRKLDAPSIDDDVKDPGDDKPRRGHMLALQAGFLGSTWQYHFNGAIDTGGPQPDKFTADVVAGFYPGAMGRVDFWPLEWIGVEADGSLSAIQFKLNADGGAAINPSEFVAIHGTAGAFAKARYVFGAGLPGLGVGARLGYRFWGASVEAQTLQGGDASGAALTVVPGFTFHALAVGIEVGVPVQLLNRRLEIELRADGLPATFYKEEPDNPGQSSLAFGWSASLCARYEIFAGLFAELGLNTVGATVDYKGVPENPRQTLDARNNPVPLAGGSVLNWTGGFNLGAGYAF